MVELGFRVGTLSIFEAALFAIKKIVEFQDQFHELVVVFLRSDLIAECVHAFSFFRGHTYTSLERGRWRHTCIIREGDANV